VNTLQPSLLRVLAALCASVDTPRSLGIYLRAKHNCFLEDGPPDRTGRSYGLLRQRTDPSAYLTIDSYRKDNACTEFLRKCRLDGIVSKADRAQAARDSFWDSEKVCARTNARLRSLIFGEGLIDLAEIRIQDFLGRAKDYIRKCLGPVPSELNCSFGPGATYGCKGFYTTIPDKIESRVEITRGALLLSPLVIERTAWYRQLVNRQPLDGPYKFIRGNRFTTVPKTALKDRGICVEPSGNVYLQKGVGKAIKRRIKYFTGFDLDFAQDRHRTMACEASRTGSHATIDLEAASDTVSYDLVKFLFPSDWFELLDCLRSPFTQIGGKWVKLEKFSSMGNGYTFELETLIFASLAYACGGEVMGQDFSVFGDDIIIPTEFARDLISVLKFCGFKPNGSKTFLDGPFRESCGGDFFDGAPVRAHNLEEDPSAPEDWISLANGLRRLGSLDPGCDFRTSYPHTAWMRCLDAIPAHIRRLRGPLSLGDLVINDEEGYQFVTRTIGKDRKGPFRFIRVYRPIAKRLPLHHWKGGVLYAAALYGIGSSHVSTRGVQGYKVGLINYP